MATSAPASVSRLQCRNWLPAAAADGPRERRESTRNSRGPVRFAGRGAGGLGTSDPGGPTGRLSLSFSRSKHSQIGAVALELKEQPRLRDTGPARRLIGYLLPEFPGQTHAFFWREISALGMLGVDADVVSTRRPESAIICHDWSREAMARTTYLYPPGVGALARGAGRLTIRPGRTARCMAAAARALGAHSPRDRARVLGLALMGAQLSSIARRREWEHVHVHSCADAAAIALCARLLGGPSYSLTLHGDVEGYGPGQDLKWRHAAFGFVVARALLPGLKAAAPSLEESKVDVAPMGVEVSGFTRNGAYGAVHPGPVRIVTCGRLHLGKGHLELVRAVSQLRREGADVELRIIGEGPARAEIETLVRELGLSSSVHLLGAAPERTVRDELEMARVFALASHQEALGVATMEAMSMGVPVVVTGVGGVPELVRHGVDGLLVPAHDPLALASALRTVLRDHALATRMGASGAARVRAHFHSGISAERLAARLGASTAGSVAPIGEARKG